MDRVVVDLKVEKDQYLTSIVQHVDSDLISEIEVEEWEDEPVERINALVQPLVDWVCDHLEDIKSHLARELVKEFNRLRVAGEKFVPYDGFDAIRAQLGQVASIQVFEEAFDVSFWVVFNGYRYRAYCGVRSKDFTFEESGILTMGGFTAPKTASPPDLSTAAALYEWHQGHSDDPNLYKAYVGLPADQVEAYVDLFIADDTAMDDRVYQALHLALFSHAGGESLPDKLYRCLVDEEVFYPGEMFLRADHKFIQDLIDGLGTVDDEDAYILPVSHILCALAAMPCQRVNDFLIANSLDPLPIWARKLHWRPSRYATVGGWEARDGDAPRMLYDDKVTAFEQCPTAKASPKSPVTVLDEKCGFCGQPLTLVFNDAQPLAACLDCSCYQTLFMQIDDTGLRWHPASTPGKFLTDNPEYMHRDAGSAPAQFAHGLRPSKEKRLPMWTANQFAQITRTQIGGMPTAINEVKYPVCPGCDQLMRFVAQLDMADLDDGEGLYYFYACDSCRVTAVNYDQS